MTFGVVLFVIGVAYMLKNLGLFSGPVWEVLWPLLLIALGLWLMSGRKSLRDYCNEWRKGGREK